MQEETQRKTATVSLVPIHSRIALLAVGLSTSALVKKTGYSTRLINYVLAGHYPCPSALAAVLRSDLGQYLWRFAIGESCSLTLSTLRTCQCEGQPAHAASCTSIGGMP